ncbi:RNA 2',3'-cyclic phosphodiesterase [Patescibacteria group bacterium]|nr:RNA 2',3'-cyclic phosphodiesterase [Patescibacteria group bacterium]
MTLKFLGNINSDLRVAKIKSKDTRELLKRINAAIEKCVENVYQFDIIFNKIGYFSKEQFIVWLGANTNHNLLRLVQNLDDNLAVLGFEKEKRKYNSHITLGRGRHIGGNRQEELKYTILNHKFQLTEKFSVRGISLIDSTLTSSGPIYKTLNTYKMLKS